MRWFRSSAKLYGGGATDLLRVTLSAGVGDLDLDSFSTSFYTRLLREGLGGSFSLLSVDFLISGFFLVSSSAFLCADVATFFLGMKSSFFSDGLI